MTNIVQSDFTFVAGAGTGTPAGGNDGTTQDNSALASPLTGNGTYCREFTWPGGTNRTLINHINTTPDGGLWVGLDETRSISIRAWVRMDSASLGIGLGVKTGVFKDSLPRVPSGYTLMLGGYGDTATNTQTDLNLHIYDHTTTDWTPNGNVTDIRTDMTASTWHRIRLDVIPVSTSKDILKVYTATLGSPDTWVLETTTEVLSTDSYYPSWSDGTSNHVGFIVHGATSGVAYIDTLQVLLENV